MDGFMEKGDGMEEQVSPIEDDMLGANVEGERKVMRERAERVRRRLSMNLVLPLPKEETEPKGISPRTDSVG